MSERVTPLRASGERSALFFVHNDNGRGVYTHALARCLDPDRPVYAVHLHGLDGPALPATVEAIAASRLQAVRDARPHGPYVLGGHCYGGIIALEMARQLRADGERVEAVVMIDTSAPAIGLRALHRVSDMLGRLRGLPPDARAGLFVRLERAREGIGGWARYYRNRFRILRRSGTRAQLDSVMRKLAGTAGALARAFDGRTQSRARARPRDVPPVLTEPRQTYVRAVRQYVPPRYAGLVALFRAEQFPAHRPDLGWSRLLPHLEVRVIPGDHHTCITRHVATFATHLEDVLHRAGDTS